MVICMKNKGFILIEAILAMIIVSVLINTIFMYMICIREIDVKRKEINCNEKVVFKK